MADRLLGYPSKITITGNVISWAAGEYDKILFDTFTTSHYVYDLTIANAQAITAIGGQQPDGTYEITVTDASTWSTGDRASPMADNGGANYTTVATLFSASVDGDRALCWAAEDTADIRGWWFLSKVSTTNQIKCISFLGMLPKQQVRFDAGNSLYWYKISGILTNTVQQRIENIEITAQTAFYYYDTGTVGGGYRISRCRFYNNYESSYTVSFRPSASTPNVCQIDNCMLMGACLSGVYVQDSPVLIYNNTVACTTYTGSTRGNIMIYGTAACTITNNICVRGQNKDYGHFSGADNSIRTKNISEDATGNVGYQNKTFSDIGFLYNNSNDAFVNDFRLISSSAYVGAGDVIPGVDFDIDGNDITVSAPIGCSAGVDLVVPATYAAVTDVRSNVDRGDGGLGTLLVPPPTDVRFGIGIDNTTGSAYIPVAADVRFGTNIDATTGTAYIPVATDVRNGISVDNTVGSASIPIPADVRFGTAIDATTGTAYIPVASDVRSGVNVDAATGTASIPSPNDVQTGVNVDATVGNFDAPAITDVRTTIGYGSNGTEFTGAANIPIPADVRTGIAVDATIGTAAIPAITDVRSGISVDTGVGTASIPNPNDVQTGVSVDATVGNFDVPATTDVRTAIGYGSNGTEFTGNVDIPIEADVRISTNYGANGIEYTGTLFTGGTPSVIPTGLTVINSGDNVTWLVTTTGAAIGAAINVYNQADDTLITTIDASALTADLIAGQSIYIKALESNRIESSRYPAASGIIVPVLGAAVTEAGILSFNNLYGSGTIDLYYNSGLNFGSGTLYKVNKNTGISTTQTLSNSGQITATGITLGVWDFYIIPENSAGTKGEHSNVITVKYDGLGSFGIDYFDLMWRKDLSTTWHSKQFGYNSKQISHNINISGKSIQLRIQSDVPNQNIELRNINLHARMRGRSMNVVRS